MFRFIYVETAFLWKWWKTQHDFVKHQFTKFIRNGQLEIIGGAWSMNDEAVTHYQSIIDQFTWGLRYLYCSVYIFIVQDVLKLIITTNVAPWNIHFFSLEKQIYFICVNETLWM